MMWRCRIWGAWKGVYFTKQKVVEIFGGKIGIQALNLLSKRGFGTRECLVDGNWIAEPIGKVCGMRFRFSPQLLECVEQVAKTWTMMERMAVQSPSKRDKVLEKLTLSRASGDELVLFCPWGPRYKKGRSSIAGCDPELATLREMASVAGELAKAGYNARILIMPADVYGTEINSLDRSSVLEYFRLLEEEARRLIDGVCFVPWSRIREGNMARYNEIKARLESLFSAFERDGEFTGLARGIVDAYKNANNPNCGFILGARRKAFSSFIRKRLLELEIKDGYSEELMLSYPDAMMAAGFFNPAKAGESAKMYCMERLAEAFIINEVYDPIKLSLVRKEKDLLDGPLKRVYIINGRAPWLEG